MVNRRLQIINGVICWLVDLDLWFSVFKVKEEDLAGDSCAGTEGTDRKGCV